MQTSYISECLVFQVVCLQNNTCQSFHHQKTNLDTGKRLFKEQSFMKWKRKRHM